MATIHSKGRDFITSLYQCDCGFFTAMELPCRHIFSLRKHTEMSFFEAKLCAVRWTRNYYQSSHRVFSSKGSNSTDITVSSVNRLPTAKVLTQHEKYRKVLTIGQRLANVASCISTREFSYAMQCLEKIVKAWEQGQQVAIQIVDPACQDDEEASNCIGGYPCGKNKPDVGIDLDHRVISDPPVDLDHYNAHDLPDINDPSVNLDHCNPPVNLDHHDTNDPPIDLEQHDINDPAVNLDHHDTNDPPIDLEQHDICDPAINHDTNDPPIDLEQHDICDPAINLDHHDTNDPPIDLEQHDINDPAVNLDHHDTNDPPIDLEQHDINDPSASLHDHDINDPSAKLDNHVINDSPDLKSIKLPPKIRKRGRPKGAGLTVIGLPKKKKCTDYRGKGKANTQLDVTRSLSNKGSSEWTTRI